MLAGRRRSVLLAATRDAVRLRVYGMNPLLVLRPKDVELLLAELIEWRAELLDTTTKRRLPEQQVPRNMRYTRRAEYLHGTRSDT
jgi:hypothetical protein